MAPRFILDQNFPTNVLAALGYIREAALTPLRDFDATLTQDVEDWEILVAISRREFDGFITGDDSMLWLSKEITVLIQTRLTLVVTAGVTHNPLLGTGLLLIHLPHIAHQTVPGTAQLWEVKPPRRTNHADPWDQLRKIAERTGEEARALYERERLGDF